MAVSRPRAALSGACDIGRSADEQDSSAAPRSAATLAPADEPTIRRATVDDVPTLAHLEESLYEDDFEDEEDLETLLGDRERSEVWIMERAGHALGSLLLRHGRTNTRILGIQVDQGKQGKGHGRRLLTKALHRARQQGKDRVTLEVRPDNERAIRFYQKAGFHRIGTRPRFYSDGSHAIRMALTLDE